MIFSRKTGSNVAKAALVAAFAGAAVTGVAPLASASTSSTTNGCYSWWGNTSSDGHCTDPYVTYSGYYQNYAYCDFSSDQSSSWTWYSRGSKPNAWGVVECTFSVSQSHIHYSAG